MCVCGGGGVGGGGGGGRADEDLKISTPYNDMGKIICPEIEKKLPKDHSDVSHCHSNVICDS